MVWMGSGWRQFFAANAGIDPLTVGAVLESAVNDLESEWNAFLGAHEVELVRAHGLVAQLLPLRLVRMVDMPSKSAARLLLAYRGALDRADLGVAQLAALEQHPGRAPQPAAVVLQLEPRSYGVMSMPRGPKRAATASSVSRDQYG